MSCRGTAGIQAVEIPRDAVRLAVSDDDNIHGVHFGSLPVLAR